jgi:hypothetical protein
MEHRYGLHSAARDSKVQVTSLQVTSVTVPSNAKALPFLHGQSQHCPLQYAGWKRQQDLTC